MDYISFSQFNTYVKCPRSWYLSKIQQAEEKQTWYIPIGSAVHSMIESYLTQSWSSPDLLPAEKFLYPLIEKQMEIEPDLSKWMAGGPKDAPITHEKALQRVSDCFERALKELSEVDPWEVEYDASGSLPGLSVPIKAYVDVIGEHKKKGPVILDWKTGSTKPDNFQLQTYAALLGSGDSLYAHVGDFMGRYVMLAPGSSLTRYVDLSKVDPEEIGKKYQAVYDRMQAKRYEAKAGFTCKWCFNQENCKVNAGITPRTEYYDRSEDDGLPF